MIQRVSAQTVVHALRSFSNLQSQRLPKARSLCAHSHADPMQPNGYLSRLHIIFNIAKITRAEYLLTSGSTHFIPHKCSVAVASIQRLLALTYTDRSAQVLTCDRRDPAYGHLFLTGRAQGCQGHCTMRHGRHCHAGSSRSLTYLRRSF